MMQKNNIIFFVTSLQSGGIENYLLRFLQHMNNKFDHITIFCKSGVCGQLENDFKQIDNIEIIKKKISYINLLDYLRLFIFFRRNHFKTICDFTGNFAGIILWVADKASIRNRVVFYRGSTNRFRQTFLKMIYNDFLKRLVRKYATAILSNSQAALNFFFPKCQDDRCAVVYNGIDASSFNIQIPKKDIRKMLDIPLDSFVIGHTGRFHYSKNHKIILKVAEAICEKYNDVFFVLCGNNTEEINNYLPLNLKSKFLILGYRKDIPQILKSMDIFYFPSITEGQPNSLIEAMISSLPFVASDIEPIKETVPKDYHYWLISPYNVEMAVKRISQLKDDPVLRKNMNISSKIKNLYSPEVLFSSFYHYLTLF